MSNLPAVRVHPAPPAHLPLARRAQLLLAYVPAPSALGPLTRLSGVALLLGTIAAVVARQLMAGAGR